MIARPLSGSPYCANVAIFTTRVCTVTIFLTNILVNFSQLVYNWQHSNNLCLFWGQGIAPILNIFWLVTGEAAVGTIFPVFSYHAMLGWDSNP